jgi:hypothetical protein
MLLVLYGALTEMGAKSRAYLINAGFQFVEKYNYAPQTPTISVQCGKRNYVSHEVFFENTDSLFRYEVGGIQIGFNHRQIADAVCDKCNCLLTLSTGDIGFLAEIKRVYQDKVKLIYTYIDDTTLRGIIEDNPKITAEDAKTRLGIGADVKQAYLRYQHLFDYVVLYGGENSRFNMESLYAQYDRIIAEVTGETGQQKQYADVYISCAYKDQRIYEAIRRELNRKGLSVFDDSVLIAGTEWVSAVADAIKNAKIVVPVITDNALASQYVKRETEYALSCAENSGTLICPVFQANVDMSQHASMGLMLSHLSCVIMEDGQVEAAAYQLAEKLHKLFTAENNLRALTKQVDNYLCLKMPDRAQLWQQKHVQLCDEIYRESDGVFMTGEVCVMSRVKLISILLDMGRVQQALELCLEGFEFLAEGDAFETLAGQFALCCTGANMTEEAVQALLEQRLPACVDRETLLDKFRCQHCAAAAADRQNQPESPKAGEQNRIAQYGELAIALFEELIQSENRELSRQDLILGYERILNYCKHVGVRGEVTDHCIDRIAQLSAQEGTASDCQHSVASEALKIYLGQALPMSGEYDVFLSFKSEDEVLAKKVFDFLTQSGKEVFFSRETLLQLGESEYKEMIFEAMDRSRHMVVVCSTPDYLKTKWVRTEWDTFHNEIIDERKSGNLLLVLTDDIAGDKGRLPLELRKQEIIKMSEFRSRLLSYLR